MKEKTDLEGSIDSLTIALPKFSSLISSIVYSAVANGVDGLFIETHPDPKSAKSDPHTMLKLDLLFPILEKALKIRKAIL